MTAETDGRAAGKRAAAAEALALVEDGMMLGLGTGSTAAIFVDLLAERMKAENLRLLCVPTSLATAAQAGALDIPLTTLDDVAALDLTVDGADEADAALTLIKGGGGALLREKIVADASRRMVVIADDTKKVETLGAFPLPVEIVRFGAPATIARIEGVLADADVGATRLTHRQGPNGRYITDEGHEIVDLHLGRIGDAPALSAALLAVPGVVETGLFIGMAERLILGRADGAADTVMPVGS
ncbi:MAG: ribose-5-phosphate isomerase RpiA [Pseudomonadota bacterium]